MKNRRNRQWWEEHKVELVGVCQYYSYCLQWLCVKTKRQLTMLLLSTQRWVILRGVLLVWDFVPSLMNCCNIEKDYSPAAPHQWISRGKTWKMKFAFLLISWTFVEADRKWHVELPETRSFMWSSMSLGMRGYFWYTVSEYTPITCNTVHRPGSACLYLH